MKNVENLIIEREFTTLEHSAKVVAARLRQIQGDAKKSGATLTKEGRAALSEMLTEVETVAALATEMLGNVSSTKSVSLQHRIAIEHERTKFLALRLDHPLPAGSAATTKTANARPA